MTECLNFLGTYFNCIMFMVASSVVTTIMILNYHHRLADTHEMPNWVKHHHCHQWHYCHHRHYTQLYDHRHHYHHHCYQVRFIFLQWIPWILRMSRPGEKITRKTIMMQVTKMMKDLFAKDIHQRIYHHEILKKILKFWMVRYDNFARPNALGTRICFENFFKNLWKFKANIWQSLRMGWRGGLYRRWNWCYLCLVVANCISPICTGWCI